MRDEKGNWERAKPAAVLSVDEIEHLLAAWLANRRVVAAELLDGGLMNSNYRLHLSAEPEVCVLRIYDRDPAACGREVAVLRRLHGSAPVPQVFYACLTPTPNAAACAVLSFVEGISLYDLRRDGDAAAVSEASHDIGRVLAGLAQFQFSRVGPLTPNLDVDETFMVGPVSNAALIDQLMRAPHFQARVGRKLRERIQWFAETHERRATQVASKPTLVHGDFNSRNVLVQQTKRGWRLSGILDWEFALSASPYVDIGNFLRYERPPRRRYEPAFSHGLRDGGMELPPDWLLLARLMDLPACVELIGRQHTPPAIVDEVRRLIADTVGDGEDAYR